MNSRFRRTGRVRLGPDAYRKLAQDVLERDGWRCQHCGRHDQLQIHHIVRRSQSGADCEDNLIVLCSECHEALHSDSSH
jgi:5-methylcytosine-specific restriction endonuclease McrA